MNLDNIKNEWNKIGKSSEDGLPINKEQLQEITRANYSNNIKKLALPEIIFGLFYLYLLVIFINFNQYFKTPIQQLLSYLAISLVIFLPVLSLSSMYSFYKTRTLLDSYKNTLKQFRQQCKRFKKLQYTIVILNLFLMLICAILIPKVYSENLSTVKTTIAFAISGFIAFGILFLVWKFYKKQINRTEELLKNLGEVDAI